MSTTIPAARTVAERLADVESPTARAQREALFTACDIVLRARPVGPDIEEGLIDEDPPQEHETIAAMSHAMTLDESGIRAAAWAWYERRLALVARLDAGIFCPRCGSQDAYVEDIDATTTTQPWCTECDVEMGGLFDDVWPRILTWTDEQVAEVERWLVDSTLRAFIIHRVRAQVREVWRRPRGGHHGAAARRPAKHPGEAPENGARGPRQSFWKKCADAWATQGVSGPVVEVTPRSRVAPPRPEAAQAVGDALISQDHEMSTTIPAARTVYEHLCDIAERLADVESPTARAQREALFTACDIVLRARPVGPDIEEGLIDEDPPQEHETIAAMSHAMTLAGIDLRDALADLRDAERDLEVERREAAKARQRLADAINSMSSARDMTGDPNVARYLAIAIEQAEFPLPLAEVMR